MRRFHYLLCFLWLLALAACTTFAQQPTDPPLVLVTLDPNATATPTPFQPGPSVDAQVINIILTEMSTPTETPSSTETPTTVPPTATQADTPTPVPTSPPPTTIALPTNTRTHYTLYVTLDYTGRTVAVNEEIRYTNNTGQTLSDIVLAAAPNLWPNCFSLDHLDQDGAAVSNYTLNGQRLSITPARPLDPGAVTTISIGYNLKLPAKSQEGTFGYRFNQINLTDWFPFIVPYDGDWLLHDPWSFGEHLVYDAVDFDINVLVAQPDVVLAASAPGEVTGPSAMRYHLEGARTFAISASDRYQVDESAVGPIVIRAYYFAGHEDSNKAVLWMGTQSLGLFEAKFGPYPYPSLSIVEADLADGQEYDGLVFLASKFYTEYNGTAKSNLVTIGTHEISHQWWFGAVGNDQASEPWLDEALSVYSERLFYEYNYPRFGDWWWNFRVDYSTPQGYVDGSLNSFATFRAYVDAVYLNGAHFLEELRVRIGDEAFFAFLQDYASSYTRSRATTHDFFSVLRRHTSQDFSDIMQTYLQGEY